MINDKRVILKDHLIRIQFSSIFPYIFAFYCFILSLIIFSYYLNGDQQTYRLFYKQISSFNLLDGFDYYQKVFGGFEIGYYLISYIFSGLLDKDIVMSFANSLIGFYLAKYFISIRISPLVLVLLSLNYYLLVLFTSAERLKFGCLFFLVGISVGGVSQYLFYLFSIFSHTQMLLNFLSKIISDSSDNIKKIFTTSIFVFKPYQIIIYAFIGIFVFYYLHGHMESKYEIYSSVQINALAVFTKSCIFILLTVIYAQEKKFEALIMQLPFFLINPFLSGDRLTIFMYIVFMYYGVKYKSGLNAGVLVTSAYFFYTGILFIIDVLNTGQGFTPR